MEMVTQNTTNTQEVISDVLCNIPVILVNDTRHLYLLVKDLHKDLEHFILTCRTDKDEFHVFTEEQEKSMLNAWRQHGFEVTYHSQKMDYMGRHFSIKYMEVLNPKNGMNVSLIPWFLLPGRPFPVFVYLYAVWHYNITEKKSLKDSADATGKLFKIDKFHKSTVCRNIKAMENFIDASKIDEPLNIIDLVTPSGQPFWQTNEEMIAYVSEVLMGCPSMESLKESYGDMVRKLPDPIRPTMLHVLSNIPVEHSTIFKSGDSIARRKPRDARIRPSRPRNKGAKRVQRRDDFVDSVQIEKTRKAFIEFSCNIVLDAAVKYHRFLIKNTLLTCNDSQV